MYSRKVRYVAAAVILVAAYAVIHIMEGAGNGASVALARVQKAIAEVPWIHVQTQIDTPEQNRQIEEWFSCGERIEIRREQDGVIRYRDESCGTLSVYDRAGNMITISSLHDDYAVPRRTPLPASSAEMLDQFDELIEGGTRSVTTEQRNGRAVEILHATRQVTDDVATREDFTIIVDVQSKLPISVDALVTREDGTTVAKMHGMFDYPAEGPHSLYSLGVPQEAKVIDRRPDPNAAAKAQIRSDFATDPANPDRQVLLLSGAVNLDFVRIPPGEFLMGSPDTEIGYPAQFLKRFGESMRKKGRPLRPDDEGPQQAVKIARGFYLSKCEVTCAQFRRFRPEFRKLPHSVGALGRKLTRLEMDLDALPACVGLDDAKAFCDWLSEKTGLKVRLPSEAEWEYACRAGTQTRFFWGDAEEDAGQYANVGDKAYVAVDPNTIYPLNTDDGSVGPAPVGQYRPNAFGLYDMLGNAPEWTTGVYSENAHGIDPQNRKPDSDAEDDQEVYCRGGGWRAGARQCRCASRERVSGNFLSDTRASAIGFRILIEEPQ